MKRTVTVAVDDTLSSDYCTAIFEEMDRSGEIKLNLHVFVPSDVIGRVGLCVCSFEVHALKPVGL